MLTAFQVRFSPARGKGNTSDRSEERVQRVLGLSPLREALDLLERKGPQEEAEPDRNPLGLFRVGVTVPVPSSPFCLKEGDQRETKILQSVTFGLDTLQSCLNYRLTLT